MDSMSAFLMGEASRGKPLMVFDWDTAARLIVERGAMSASAGLEGDWDWTGGTILENGEPVASDDTYTYLASTWASPQLEIDGEIVDCWLYQDATPEWASDTYWPDSAAAILQAGKGSAVSS
jgi:hypothetical protein